MTDIKVSRDGRMTRNGVVIGWADQHRQTSGRWRAVLEGGREEGGFRTRRDAVLWLLGEEQS